MSAPLRIGFMSAHNPYDRGSFSGTAYYMLRALRARPEAEIRVLGRHRPGRLTRIFRKLRPPRSMQRRDVDDRGLDAIVAPVASALVARFGASLSPPIVLFTDATPAFLRAFYGKPVPVEADETEAKALSCAAAVVYSSDYMARRAVDEFGDLVPERVHVIPFGLNLDTLPEALTEKPPLDPIELLFIGKDWARKGGDTALAALKALRSGGIAARLTVIGCSAPAAQGHRDVEVLGYLDKNDPADAARMSRALTRAHLLVLPTRADCTPMVVAEANAHGCPVLISDTGGIASLMAPERNGRMLPLEADGAAYAAAIRELTADPDAYRALSRLSVAHCHERLTWEGWARDVVHLLETLRQPDTGGPV